MLARRGKITGSKLGDIISKRDPSKKKKGFYQLIADRLAVEPDGERPMDRGVRLEDIAIERFTQDTGIKVDTSLVIWERDDNSDIAYSPDGVIDKENAVEVKCLNSASHIEAFLTQEIPDDYRYQIIQGFVSNDDLEKMYMIFYDPRFTVKDFFFLEITRESMQKEIESSLLYEINTLKEVDEVVKSLVGF
jgi:predicted phage-related endonuclease